MEEVVAKRECKSCTLCCKLLAVDEIEKPKMHWCSLGNPRGNPGCCVHGTDAQPQSCQTFSCLWLQSTDGEVPDDWRPNDLHMVIACPTAMPDTLFVYPDKGHEAVLMRPDVSATFANLRAAGKRIIAVMPTGEYREAHAAPEAAQPDSLDPSQAILAAASHGPVKEDKQ